MARYIVKHRPTRINARDIRREWRLPGLKTAEAVKEAIDQLTEAEWLRAAPGRQGESTGRQRADFLVNPKVLEDARG